MKVWIEGDCGYPDGFAGGLISKDYPQLGMQGILADARCTVAAGQTLDIPLPVDTLGILAYPRPEAAAPAADTPARTVKQFPLPADGNLSSGSMARRSPTPRPFSCSGHFVLRSW